MTSDTPPKLFRARILVGTSAVAAVGVGVLVGGQAGTGLGILAGIGALAVSIIVGWKIFLRPDPR